MLNVISRNIIKNNVIEDIANINMILVCSYIGYGLYYQIQYEKMYNTLYYYIIFDYLFIPFHRKDSYLHHTIVLSVYFYNYIYNIKINEQNFAMLQLFKTEISSIFLGFSNLFRKNGVNKIISNTSNMLFVSSFFYYRIYNYYFNVLLNPEFNSSATTTNTLIQQSYRVTVKYSLFCLNIYWSVRIIEMIIKLSKNTKK